MRNWQPPKGRVTVPRTGSARAVNNQIGKVSYDLVSEAGARRYYLCQKLMRDEGVSMEGQIPWLNIIEDYSAFPCECKLRVFLSRL